MRIALVIYDLDCGGSQRVMTSLANYLAGTGHDVALLTMREGGTENDEAMSVVQTTDGGYAVAGYTESQGSGLADFWILKLDSLGNREWTADKEVYGGAMADIAESIIQTDDGGYAVAGHTYSQGSGLADVWVLKLDSSGNLDWAADKGVYGGAGMDVAREIIQTSDGGYVVAGYTTSKGEGQEDFYVFKLDSSGNMQGAGDTFGGTNIDKAWSIKEISGNVYIVAGETASYGSGEADFWILKLTYSNNTFSSSQPVLNGGAQTEVAYSIETTSDGGHIVAGYTNSTGAGSEDMLLLKLDSSSTVEWSRTFGGTSTDVAHSVITTADGGYAIAGYTASSGAGSDDVRVIKLDSSGQL
ncbi:hypothetical protein ACFLQK_00920 [bacterium]